MELVGFQEKQHEKLENLANQRSPVEIAKCAIKPSLADSSKFEVLLNTYTQVSKSPTKFDVPANLLDGEARSFSLKTISTMSNNDKVTTTVKCVKVDNPTKLNTGKVKQDTIIADSTGTIRLTLWEEDVNKIEEGKSYKLINMLVRCFKGCNYLSFPTDGRLAPTEDMDIGDTDIQHNTPKEVQKHKFEIK